MSSVLDARSGLQGTQEPRVFYAPEFHTTAGDDAVECAALAGLVLDPWQQLVLRHGLGERADGLWAAFRVGCCVPRQNGKGGVIEALELAGLFVFGERLIVHSAHQFDTSLEAFRRLLALIEDTPDFDRRVKRVSRSHGEEGIELRGGQRIRFRTRTKGGGRGFTGDRVILDEAMYLPETTMAALIPTMSARPNPQVWYFGSAVDQLVHHDGVEFARVREDGLAAEKESVAYFEWSADAEIPDDLSDWEASDRSVWAQANPAMGIRISPDYIANERDTLGRRAFAVERLGVGDWPRTDGLVEAVIDPRAFSELADHDSQPLDPVWFAFDVSPDRSRSSISVAGRRPDGLFHVEIVESRRGTGWVAERAAELRDNQKPAGFICDGVGPAMSLLPDLERLGVQVETLSTSDHVQACGFLFDCVEQKTVRHLGTSELLAAIRGAAKRPLEDRWAWSRKNSAVDITPLVSVTFALWGAGRDVPSGPPLVAFA